MDVLERRHLSWLRGRPEAGLAAGFSCPATDPVKTSKAGVLDLVSLRSSTQSSFKNPFQPGE